MGKKPSWRTLQGNEARCSRCGAVSIWKPNYILNHSGRRLTYWMWWKRFKQAHAHMLEDADLEDPWFDE